MRCYAFLLLIPGLGIIAVGQEPLPSAVSRPPDRIDSVLAERADRFELLNERQILDSVLKSEAIQRLPVLYDEFDRRDTQSLGPEWIFPEAARFQIRNGRATVKSGATWALREEPVSDPAVEVSVIVSDLQSKNEAGVMFRGDAETRTDGLPDHEFVVLSRNSLSVGVVAKGKERRTHTIEVAATFPAVLRVIAEGPLLRIMVNGDEFTVQQPPLNGRMTGMRAVGPADLDSFRAEGFYGQFVLTMRSPMFRPQASSVVFFQPIYGEHFLVERYGQSFGNCIQPVCEHLKFGTDVALLPARICLTPPWRCDSNACTYPVGQPILPFRYTFPKW